MKKVKEVFTNDIKEYLRKYLFSNILILVSTIYALIVSNFTNNNIFRILIICLVHFWTIETIFENKKDKYKFIILTIIISINIQFILRLLLTSRPYIYVILGYLIIVFLIGIYYLIKKNKIKFNQYLYIITNNILKFGLIYLILQVGINGLILIFSYLILNNSYRLFEFLTKIQILINGIYLIPVMLYSITNINKESGKIYKNIISYLIMPIILTAIAIFYMYIVRIIIQGEMPKNMIFSLVTFIYFCSYFIWTICYVFKDEKKFARKISKILPIMFIPLLFLQTYSLLIRIIPLGITNARYIGIMIIILETCSIILAFIKKRKYEKNIIWVLSAVVLVSLVLPATNMYNISDISQAYRLKMFLKKEDDFRKLSKEDKEKVKAIVNYFKTNNRPKDKIPSYIDINEIYNYDIYKNEKYNEESKDNYEYKETILNGYTNEQEKVEHIYYNGDRFESGKEIEIPQGYSRIKFGQCYPQGALSNEESMDYIKSGTSKEKIRNAIASYSIIPNSSQVSNGYTIDKYSDSIDLYNYVSDLIKIYKEKSSENYITTVNEYVKNYNIIATKNNVDFYITNINLSFIYDEEYLNGQDDIPKMQNVIFDGYFLFK